LEDDVLYKLATAKGDILENIALIENLEYSKKLSNEISEKVAIAKITEAKINDTSEKYRPAAIRGALFYFMLSDLPKIHSFYKFSLESFIIVINRAIDKISENKMYNPDQLMVPYGEEENINYAHKEEGEDDDEIEGEATKINKDEGEEDENKVEDSPKKDVSDKQSQNQEPS
jgi:dynein heavy chain, axonemal